MSTVEKNLVKVLFALEQDADGYPPLTAESVWGRPLGEGQCEICNIPFFAREATIEDVVNVHRIEDVLWFESMHRASRNSLVRVVLFDTGRREELQHALTGLGCTVEILQGRPLVAVNIPPGGSMIEVCRYLEEQAETGWLDVEIAIHRH